MEEIGRSERGSSAAPDVRVVGRVLVVDDHAAVREFTERALRRLGYEVAGASTTDEAVARLSEAGARFDAVLSDILMAGETGFTLAAWVHAERPGLPIVLMTGHADLGTIDAAGLPVLRKPFRRAELAAVLDRVLGRDRGAPLREDRARLAPTSEPAKPAGWSPEEPGIDPAQRQRASPPDAET